MIQLTTLMWWMAIFFGILGFMRGWRKEIVSTAGVVLALFAAFRFDSLFRGAFFVAIPPGQVLFIQVLFLFGIVFFVYQTGHNVGGAEARDTEDWQAGLLGGLMGAFNGYLIGGSLWYFFDINEYPWEALMVAPPLGSSSAQSYNLIPLVLASGGASGSGDLLALGVLGLLFFALVLA